MNENWTKIRVLQYLLFKADRLDQNAKDATEELKRSKKLDDVEFMKIYKDLLYAEFFNDIFNELIQYL